MDEAERTKAFEDKCGVDMCQRLFQVWKRTYPSAGCVPESRDGSRRVNFIRNARSNGFKDDMIDEALNLFS